MKIYLDTATIVIVKKALEDRQVRVNFTPEYCTELVQAVEGYKDLTKDEVSNIIWAMADKVSNLEKKLNTIIEG